MNSLEKGEGLDHLKIYIFFIYIYTNIIHVYIYIWASLMAQTVKNQPAMQETWV